MSINTRGTTTIPKEIQDLRLKGVRDFFLSTGLIAGVITFFAFEVNAPGLGVIAGGVCGAALLIGLNIKTWKKNVAAGGIYR